MNKKNSGIIILTAIFIIGIFTILFINLGNKSIATHVLDVLATGKTGEYIVELESLDKTYATNINEHYTLYETLDRKKEHSKYVVVISDDARLEKSAFVVSTPKLKFDENGRICRSNPLTCPMVSN